MPRFRQNHVAGKMHGCQNVNMARRLRSWIDCKWSYPRTSHLMVAPNMDMAM